MLTARFSDGVWDHHGKPSDEQNNKTVPKFNLMNWITVIWSAIAGIYLTLAGVHFLVWLKSRGLWANLLFSIAAASAAAYAGFELVLMHSQTPAEYGEVLRWLNVSVN